LLARHPGMAGHDWRPVCRRQAAPIFGPSPTSRRSSDMSGPGSAGNVIAAICSLFIPGLGQLVQGRVLWALFWFVLAGIGYGITFLLSLGLLPFGGFLVAILSCIHAAVYRPRR
jgi:hypothetical protein